MRHLTPLNFATFMLTACTAQLTMASFDVQSANVFHRSTSIHGGTTAPVSVLSATAPVSSFNTNVGDGNAAIGTILPDTLTLRTSSVRGFDIPSGTQSCLYNYGTISFTSDRPFALLGRQLAGAGSIPAFVGTVINPATNASWNFGIENTNTVPHIFGNLASPAPAGSYALTWQHMPNVGFSQFTTETFEIQLTTVPEPTCITTLAAAIYGLRRKR